MLVLHEGAAGPAAEPVERLSERAYQAIRRALRSGELQPGQRLILRPLASKLGLSATPVREALLRLVSEQALGLDERNSVLVPVLGREELDELKELRIDLEGRAAAVTAVRISPAAIEELAAIQDALEAAAAAGDVAREIELNEAFHRTILSTSGRPTLLRMVDAVSVRLGPLIAIVSAARWERTHPHPHRAILAALGARDEAAARRAMVRDIEFAFALLHRALAAARAGAEETGHFAP